MNSELSVIKNLVLPDFLLEKIPTNKSQVLNFLNNCRDEFDGWFSNVVNSKITSKDSWINYTTHKPGILNGYEWHNEKGIGGAANPTNGAYAGIVWISGDENQGGNLSVLINDNVEEVVFKLNTAIIMPSTMFHRVNHYYGSDTRVSLNFTFDIV